MTHYYTVPERVQAARWFSGNSDSQARALSLLMKAGLTVAEASSAGATFNGGSVQSGEWVVLRISDNGIHRSVSVLTDAEFQGSYCVDPRVEADTLADGSGADEPEER